jgi:hypothetical protein
MCVQDADLWRPTPGGDAAARFSLAAERTQSWERARAENVRDLSVDIVSWRPERCAAAYLVAALRGVLAAVAPHVEVLRLAVDGAPMAAARAWTELFKFTRDGAIFPRLRELRLVLEGRGAASEARTTIQPPRRLPRQRAARRSSACSSPRAA